MSARRKKDRKPEIVLEEVEEIEIVQPKPEFFERELSGAEYDVRDITWAVGLRCACGYELDLFNWNQPTEKICKKCGRAYDVRLKAYQIGEANPSV